MAALLLWPDPPAGETGAWLRAAGLEERYALVDGLRIRYVRAGAGPPLVLLHGFGASLYTWREVLPALARHHDVVAVDLPGFGGSDRPPDLKAETGSEAVVGLLDHLGFDRVEVVGHSMGGAVAVGIAGDRPERVERLVLIDAAGFNLEPGERPWLLRLLASPIGAVVVGLPKKRSIVALALRQVFHDDGKVTPHRVDEYLAPLERPGAFDSARSLLSSQGAAGPPFREQAGRVRAPTLVVWGRDDEWIPLAQANLFLRSIPDSRLRVIDACGHVPQEEQPEETAAALLAFLGAGPGQAEAP